MPFSPKPPQANPDGFHWAYRRPRAPDPYWGKGPQIVEDRKGFRNVAMVGTTLASITALGFIPLRQGRVWDKYLNTLRHIEELSPAKMFRTFQWSEILSPFGSHPSFQIPSEFFSRQFTTALGQRLTVPVEAMRASVARQLGISVAAAEATGAFTRGMTFERTGMFGRVTAGGKVLTKAALPVRLGTATGGTFFDWYSRVSGVELGITEGTAAKDLSGMTFVTAPKVDKVLGIPLSEHGAVTLQKTRVLGRYMRAYWAGQIGRLNRLLETTLDLPVIGKYLKKASKAINFNLTVKSGTATQMLLRYAGKGMVIAGAFKALQSLSYLRSQAESRPFSTIASAGIGTVIGGLLARSKKGALIGAAAGALIGAAPVFDKGILPGFATMGVKAHIGQAGYVSEPLGLTKAAREQEALMPGITQARTVLGLAGAGYLAGLATKGIGRYVATAKAGSYEAFEAASQSIVEAFKQEARAFPAGPRGLLTKARSWLWPKALKGKLGMRAAMTGGRLGLAAGLATWAGFTIASSVLTGKLPGILGTEKTAKELEDLYAGREEIPIRKGKWWEFGRSPWEGTRVSYYRPHWYPLMMSGAKTKGLWGSEKQKLESDPWLHPIKAFTDEEFKYRWEREHYYERPYPITGTYFEEVPFIGPMVGALGRLIKPNKLMHTEEWTAGLPGAGPYGLAEGSGPGGGLGKGLGVLHVPTAAEQEPAPELGGLLRGVPVSPYSARQELGRQIYNINELRGLTGFVHNAIKEQITGSQDYFDQEQQLESANRAYGAERDYWDRELGGLLGVTEGFRRFLPHRRRQIDLYNPIRNMMPAWLPGSSYYLDLQHGDPYSRVQEGEIRLPGPGYSALHPEVAGLHPEDYPLFHRYKILADVAMYSDEFQKTKLEIKTASRRGQLSDWQISQIEKINSQVSEKKKRKRFTEYQFSDEALQQRRVTVKEQISPDMFTTEEHGTIKLSGIQLAKEQMADTNADILGSPDIRRKRAIMSDYLREYIEPGAELDVYVHKDFHHRYKTSPAGPYQPAAVFANGVNLAQELVSKGVVDYQDNAYANMAKYSPLQRTAGGLWETVTHLESPLEYLQPLSPSAKFIHQRSAVEEYERSRVYGTETAFWQHPFSHFLRPAYWMAKEQLGTKEIPEHVRLRHEVDNYFDKIKYKKFNMLEKAARAIGDQQSAGEFRSTHKKTLFGLDPYGSLSDIYSALPTLERDYFQEFAAAQSEEERQRISQLLPPNELPVYQAQWNRQLTNALRAERQMGLAKPETEATLNALYAQKEAEGREITPESISQYQAERENEESYADWSRRKELNDYFKTRPLPGPDWVGWHSHADLDDVKLKLVENLGEDIHDYNLWENRRRTLARKPYLDEETLAAVTGPPEGNPSEKARQIEATLRQMLALENIQVTAVASGEEFDRVNLDILDDRKNVFSTYKKDPEFFDMVT